MDLDVKEIQCADPITVISFLDDTLCLGDSKGVLHFCSSDIGRAFKLEVNESSKHDGAQPEITAIGLAGTFPHHKSILVSDQNVVKLWRVSKDRQRCVKEYAALHDFRIHSLTVHHHWPVFVTADELSIFLWDIELAGTAHQLLGRTHSVFELEDVITSASFSEADPALLLWSSTKGTVNVGDLRLKSILTHPVAQFQHTSESQGFLTEVINSVSSAKFLDHTTLVAREFFNLKFWDLRKQQTPTKKVQVLTCSEPLGELYHSGKLYDKFIVSTSTSPGNRVATGNYKGIEVLDSNGDIKRHIEMGDTAMLNVAVENKGSKLAGVAGSKAVVLDNDVSR
mmetsp:Transcript_20236/g.37754  ORF Transcript_20236/g.37754 Transcript_20236/m.37754 type:complete len:339 (-) Transcript_20236:285-1301(-)